MSRKRQPRGSLSAWGWTLSAGGRAAPRRLAALDRGESTPAHPAAGRLGPRQLVVVLISAAAALLLPHESLLLPIGSVLGLGAVMLLLARGAPRVPMGRTERERRFMEDFPPVLMATASSMRVGLTPSAALRRSVAVLPADSPVRREVLQLLVRLAAGLSVEQAVLDFGREIRAPEIALFRSALSLVAEHGGPFSPALSRLAGIIHDRATLARQARVSTSLMRMTARIILLLCPLLLGFLSLQMTEFWAVLQHDPLALGLSVLGSTLLLGGYLSLARLSAFEP